MSKFCLNIAGDTPSSNRLFDAIVSHCVPVIISDEIELPFEDDLDYSDFSIIVHASDAMKKGYLLNLLRSIKRDEWNKMWERLKQITHHFEYPCFHLVKLGCSFHVKSLYISALLYPADFLLCKLMIINHHLR